MTYGHAERNLALIRQLEAETRQLLENLEQPDARQSADLRTPATPPLHTLVP
jgi:hypothetical protein